MTKKLQELRSKEGFTLVELLVVVVIIGILATLAIILITGRVGDAGQAKAKSNLDAAYSAAQLYVTDNSGSIPGANNAAKTANLVTTLEGADGVTVPDANIIAGTGTGADNLYVDVTGANDFTLKFVYDGNGGNCTLTVVAGDKPEAVCS